MNGPSAAVSWWIACAAEKELDLAVSEDTETVLNGTALKCYVIVNRVKNLRMPQFIRYEDFRKWFV